MTRPKPLYTRENCTAAYQLNWTLSLFAREPLPPTCQWGSSLSHATEPDGVRVLEQGLTKPELVQFFLSSKPDVAPSQIIRSVKGRLQYLLRDRWPRAFRRNYRIESVGAANSKSLAKYIAGQPKHHPMADPRVQKRFEVLQFHDPKVDLERVRYSSHGQFIYNLQVVIENAEGWHELNPETLMNTRDMVIRSVRAKGHLLSRVGLLSNHLHIAVGCCIDAAPSSVVLSLMNNIAYVQRMRHVLRFSYYVGSFGPYDRNVVRRVFGV